MKTKLILLAAFTYLFGSAIQLKAQGYIVTNGVVMNFGGFFFPNEISVLHNPNNPASPSSYTGFVFDVVNSNTFQFDPVVDIGVRVFLVSSNDPISLSPILSQSYTELIYGPNYVFTNGTPFYVGLYTGNTNNPPANGIYADPLFGWAELENVNGSIQLLSGAVEYQGLGIYAGTQNIIQAVPEPSALALLGLGGLLLGLRRRA